MNVGERGMSTFKLLVILLVLGGAATVGFKMFPVYYTKMKVQSTFELIAREMAEESELKIRARLPVLLQTQNIQPGELPQAFYDNLTIDAGFGHVDIRTHYHTIVWLMGPVRGVNPNSDYDPVQLTGMDKLRHQARVDLDFDIQAKTP